jgi:secreted PhoX family phosphatase
VSGVDPSSPTPDRRAILGAGGKNGELFVFARNDVVLAGEVNGLRGDFRGSEWGGACFDPSGEWLFVNLQDPGITFAVTGPWELGPL